MAFVFAWIVPPWADLLLRPLLMEQFDTLLIDTLNICMKEFGLEKITFVCTDSTKIFFAKLRFAGLNHNMPSFFTDSYCAGGI